MAFHYRWQQWPSKRLKLAGLAILSLVVNEFGPTDLPATLLHVCLVFYTIYVASRSLLPRAYPELAPSRGVSVVLAGGTVSIAWVFSEGFTGEAISGLSFILVTLVVCIVLDAYFRKFDGSDLEYPTDHYVHIVDQWHPGMSRTDVVERQREWQLVLGRADEGWLVALTDFMSRAVVVGVLGIPVSVLGGLLGVVGLFYPISDLLILGAAIFGPSLTRLSTMFKDEREVFAAANVQTPIVETLSSQWLQPKGLFSALFVLAGVTFPALVFFTFLGLIPVVWDLVSEFASVESQLQDLVLGSALAVAILSTLLLFSVFGLWYWRAELRRLPTFLQHWWKHNANDSAVKDVEDPDVTRPPGWMLPPTVLLLTTSATVYIYRFADSKADVVSGLLLYLVLWFGGIALVLWSVRLWMKRDPQPVSGEGRALVAGFFVQNTGIMVVSAVFLSTTGASTAAILRRVSGFVLLPVFSTAGFYFADVVEWSPENRSRSRYVPFGYAITCCVVFSGVASFYNAGVLAAVMLFGASIVALLAGVEYLGEWMKRRHLPADQISDRQTTVDESGYGRESD